MIIRLSIFQDGEKPAGYEFSIPDRMPAPLAKRAAEEMFREATPKFLAKIAAAIDARPVMEG